MTSAHRPLTARRARSAAPWTLALVAAVGCQSTTAPEPVPEPVTATPAAAGEWDFERVDLALRLDAQTRGLEGVAELTLRARAARVETVLLELEGLTVERVRDADGEELAHSHLGGVLTVLLPEAETTDAELTLVVEYAGRPQRGLLWVDGAELGADYVAVDGRPGTAAWWFPAPSDGADVFHASLAVDAPEGWTVAAFGAPSSGAVPRFASDHPLAADDLAFVAGPLHAAERVELGVRVLGPASAAAELEMAAERAGRARLFGAVWFEGAARGLPRVATAPLTLVHAPEVARPGSGGRNLALLGDLDWTGVVTSTLEREAAARVVPGDASARWIAPALGRQAFAAFAAELAGEDGRGEALQQLDDTVRAERPRGARGILAPADAEPLAQVEPWRAAWGGRVLELVRAALGDERYAATLHALFESEVPRALTTAELFTCFDRAAEGDEATPGLGLDWTQWVQQPGAPKIDVSWEHEQTTGEIVVRVRQSQLGEAGTPRVFAFPTRVEVADGGRVTVHDVRVDERTEILRLPVEERPRWVRFDVDGWLPGELTETKDLSEWFAISSDTERSWGRVRALEALADRARDARRSERSLYLTHFDGRLERDPSARARAAAATALGGLGGEAAERWLATAATEDSDPTVRRAALEALAELADDAVTDLAVLAERLADTDPETVEASMRLRAAAEPVTASFFLRSRFERGDDPRTRAAALDALTTVRNDLPEAVILRHAVDGDEAIAVRVEALRALGRRRSVDASVVEALAPVLRDPSPQVRAAAIEALSAWRGEAARALLAEHAERTVEPDERRAAEAALGRAR
ncbi:MAG: HEAT repeat domain-containing protein [Planctomycetota bacterium]